MQDDRTAVKGMVAEYFGYTSNEGTHAFTGFDADIRFGVLIPDVQDRQDALDAFGDDLAVGAGVTDHVFKHSLASTLTFATEF
jgi:hypothetical protein